MSTTYSPVVTKAIINLGFVSLNQMQSEMLKISKKAKQILLFSQQDPERLLLFSCLFWIKRRCQTPDQSIGGCPFQGACAADRAGVQIDGHRTKGHDLLRWSQR